MIGCKWVFKKQYKADGSCDKHKSRLVEKYFAQKEASIMGKHFPPWKNGYHPDTLFLGSSERLEIPLNGCKNYFLEWIFER